MDGKELDARKDEIQELGLNAIKDFFKIDDKKFQTFDKDFIRHIHSQAKIAMQFEREMNVSKRAIEMNYIRVFKMIAEDKKELRDLVRKGLPQYLPIDNYEHKKK